MEFFKPSYVAPVVVWLSHEDCPESGGVFETAGGYVGKYRWQRSEGKVFVPPSSMTPETIRDSWTQITDMSRSTCPNSFQGLFFPQLMGSCSSHFVSEHTLTLVNTLKGNSEESEATEMREVVTNDVIHGYSIDDAILYALSG